MKRNEFLTLCNKYLIDPEIALENEKVREALKNKDNKKVEELLKNEF